MATITVITLTEKDIQRLEMIAMDNDREDALALAKELRQRMKESTIQGIKSHLDA